MAKSSGSGSGSGAVIGLFIFVFIFMGVGVFLYFNPRLLQGEGDKCKPTEDELVDESNEKTYELDEDKECIPTECVEGYTLSNGSCVSSTPTSSQSSSSDSSPSSSSDSSPSSSSSPTTSSPPSIPTVPIPMGETCDMQLASAIPNAVSYRLNDAGICTLETCSTRYKVSPDRKSCIKDEAKSNTVKQYDCSAKFSADETGACWLGNEAGIKFNFDRDSATYCGEQLKYIDVTVSSDANPAVKFRTRMDPASRSAGVRELPPGLMDANLLFTVNPVMKDGESLLDTPKIISLPLDKSKGSCQTAGIPVTDAYVDWNENDNLYKVHWVHLGGNKGSVQLYDRTGKRVMNTPHLMHGQSGVTTTTSDMTGGTWCEAGTIFYRDSMRFGINQYPNRNSRIVYDCWAGRAEARFENPGDGPVPRKSPLK